MPLSCSQLRPGEGCDQGSTSNSDRGRTPTPGRSVGSGRRARLDVRAKARIARRIKAPVRDDDAGPGAGPC